MFSPTSLNRCGIAFGQPAVVGSGITLYPGTQLETLRREDIGNSITQDVFGIFETAGETLGIVELSGD